ncbi:MAG: AAA family ATPase, partial [Culicoidibacterales bacterium]
FEPNTEKGATNIIYGENGAGKTTVISAISLLRTMALGYQSRFITGAHNLFIKDTEITFYIEVDLGNEESFEYILICSQGEKYNEIINYCKKTIIDQRTGEFVDLTEVEKERLNTYKLNNKSILDILVNDFEIKNKDLKEILGKIYNWFKTGLVSIGRMDEQDFAQMFQEANKKEEFLLLCKKFNLPIYDVNITSEKKEKPSQLIEIEKIMRSESDIDKIVEVFDVSFIHKDGVPITYDMESSGTKKLVSYFIQVLISPNAVLLVDEFDISLHIELSKALIEFFQENGNQFITTTHNLFHLEEKSYSPSAFWFIEKNEDECTELYSLKDIEGINLRGDKRQNWRKMYQDFRFGAYPKRIVGVSDSNE